MKRNQEKCGEENKLNLNSRKILRRNEFHQKFNVHRRKTFSKDFA
jgi:hypothetical protein